MNSSTRRAPSTSPRTVQARRARLKDHVSGWAPSSSPRLLLPVCIIAGRSSVKITPTNPRRAHASIAWLYSRSPGFFPVSCSCLPSSSRASATRPARAHARIARPTCTSITGTCPRATSVLSAPRVSTPASSPACGGCCCGGAWASRSLRSSKAASHWGGLAWPHALRAALQVHESGGSEGRTRSLPSQLRSPAPTLRSPADALPATPQLDPEADAGAAAAAASRSSSKARRASRQSW
mmetsp:Transcript_43102/g.97421  ORF Transcript_43102/g.97421 Transcript_43102/m.97421 type:complete len:238 (-) Transcript_43102:514-1227(-)